jgi:hypothetical protein
MLVTQDSLRKYGLPGNSVLDQIDLSSASSSFPTYSNALMAAELSRMSPEERSVRPVRLTLAWTEQAMAAHKAGDHPVADISDNDPFAGPVFDADADTMWALEEARVLSRLDEIPHEGLSLADSYEEGWFDLDQLDGLIAALEMLIEETHAAAGRTAAPALSDSLVARWLGAALTFSQEAKRLNRGVCFWL